jgi:hypothetical protein
MSAGNPNPFDLLVEQIRAVVREEIAAAHVNGNGNGPSPTLLSAEAAAKCFCVPKKLDQRSGSPRRTALGEVGPLREIQAGSLQSFIKANRSS